MRILPSRKQLAGVAEAGNKHSLHDRVCTRLIRVGLLQPIGFDEQVEQGGTISQISLRSFQPLEAVQDLDAGDLPWAWRDLPDTCSSRLVRGISK